MLNCQFLVSMMQEAWFYKMTSEINLFNLVPSLYRGRHGFGQSHPEPGWLWPQPKTSSEWNRLSQVGQEWTLIYPLDLSTTFKPKKTAELLSVLQNLTKIPKNWSKSPRATVSFGFLFTIIQDPLSDLWNFSLLPNKGCCIYCLPVQVLLPYTSQRWITQGIYTFLAKAKND